MNKRRAKTIILQDLRELQTSVVEYEEMSKMISQGKSAKTIREAFSTYKSKTLTEALNAAEFQQMQSMHNRYSGRPQSGSPQGSFRQPLAGGEDMFNRRAGEAPGTSDAFSQAAVTTGRFWLLGMIADKLTGNSGGTARTIMIQILSQIPMSQWKLMYNQPNTACNILTSAAASSLGAIGALMIFNRLSGGAIGGGIPAQLGAQFLNQRFVKDPIFRLTGRGRELICSAIAKALKAAKSQGGIDQVAFQARSGLQRMPGPGFLDDQPAANRGFTRRMRNFQEAVETLNPSQLKIVEDFQSRMKTRLRAAHRRILDSGRPDLFKVSAPFSVSRSGTSNAFLAKEGIKIKVPRVYDKSRQVHHNFEIKEEPLEEISSMATSAVAFSPVKSAIEEEDEE